MFFELILFLTAIAMFSLAATIGDLIRELRAWRKLSTTRREEHQMRVDPD